MTGVVDDFTVSTTDIDNTRYIGLNAWDPVTREHAYIMMSRENIEDLIEALQKSLEHEHQWDPPTGWSYAVNPAGSRRCTLCGVVQYD